MALVERSKFGLNELLDANAWVSTFALHGILSGGLLPALLGDPDENSFRTPDVAEPVDVFVVDDFIDHCRTELAEPGEGVVDVLAGEHDRSEERRVGIGSTSRRGTH